MSHDAPPVLVFHPGTQHSRVTARALQDLGRLKLYATSIDYRPDRLPYLLERLPGPAGRALAQQFARYELSDLDPELVYSQARWELLERILRKRPAGHALALKVDRHGNRALARSLRSLVRGPEEFSVWSYNSVALDIFTMAKAAGRRCILDRTTVDLHRYNTVNARLAEKFPQYAQDIGRYDMPPWRIALEQREYELADRIVVGSAFAAETIRAECGDPAIARKVEVLNYSYAPDLFDDPPARETTGPDAPVRFLFVGSFGPRKGLFELLEAFASLPPGQARLSLAGVRALPEDTPDEVCARIDVLGVVPRADMPGVMARHDVFILPSHLEGSAVSILEALASGMAVIQSREAGDGVTPASGIMLDRVDAPAIAAAMRRCVEDRAQLLRWQKGALEDAANYSFAAYRQRIAELLSREDSLRASSPA